MLLCEAHSLEVGEDAGLGSGMRLLLGVDWACEGKERGDAKKMLFGW